jgi:hypothetical protein
MYNYAPDMVLHMVCIIMPCTIDIVSMNVKSRWVELSDRTIHFDVVLDGPGALCRADLRLCRFLFALRHGV